jgi:hypothetical protein
VDPLASLRWELDPAALFEDAVGPADEWQRQVLRSKAKRRLLLASRQSGKSQTCAILALHKALYSPGSLVLCIAPALRQSTELTHKVYSAYRDLGLERVMNLGENRIGMRIPRSAWFLRDLRSRIPKPFLIEFITRSRVNWPGCSPIRIKSHFSTKRSKTR